MIRSRGSVPIAENISAYLATCSVFFFDESVTIFRYLQKYGVLSSCRFVSQGTTNSSRGWQGRIIALSLLKCRSKMNHDYRSRNSAVVGDFPPSSSTSSHDDRLDDRRGRRFPWHRLAVA